MIAYVRMLTGSSWFVVLLPVPAAELYLISCTEPPRSSVLAIKTFGLREDQAHLEQKLDRARNRGSWNQGQGYGYQEPKHQRMELEAPRYESVRPSARGSIVTAEGRGAPPGYTPYRASTPEPAETRDIQVYHESADRSEYYAN